MVQHKPGERRRSIVVASVVTLAIYLLIVALAHWTAGTKPGELSHDFLIRSLTEQSLALGAVWVGMAVWTLAQRKLIAYRQGAYWLIEAVTQVRALRGLGLGFGVLAVAVLVGSAVEHVLSTRLTIIGALVALICFGLGLPDAPAQRYAPSEAGSM
jgi:hypothetical protein